MNGGRIHTVHYFNPDVALEFGIEKAVLIQHLAIQIEKNMANNMHFHDGRFWTYNTLNALGKQFPYIGTKSIHRHLSVLVEKGVLVKGNYNQVPTDRTVWYAFTDRGYDYVCSISRNLEMHFSEMENAFPGNEKSETAEKRPLDASGAISQNREMHFSKMGNDIDTLFNDSEENISSTTEKENPTKEKGRKGKFVPDLSFIEDEEKRAVFQSWIDFRVELKKPYGTQTGVERGYAQLCNMAHDSLAEMKAIVDQSMGNEWQGLFPLKTQGNERNNQRSGSAILVPLKEVQGGSSTL